MSDAWDWLHYLKQPAIVNRILIYVFSLTKFPQAQPALIVCHIFFYISTGLKHCRILERGNKDGRRFCYIGFN